MSSDSIKETLNPEWATEILEFVKIISLDEISDPVNDPDDPVTNFAKYVQEKLETLNDKDSFQKDKDFKREILNLFVKQVVIEQKIDIKKKNEIIKFIEREYQNFKTKQKYQSLDPSTSKPIERLVTAAEYLGIIRSDFFEGVDDEIKKVCKKIKDYSQQLDNTIVTSIVDRNRSSGGSGSSSSGGDSTFTMRPVNSEAIKNYPNFDELVGLEEAKQFLIDYFILPTRYPNAVDVRSQGILLYGPPGTGKTTLAKVAAAKLSEEVGILFYTVTAAELVSSYVGQTGKNITRMFQIAREALKEKRKSGSEFPKAIIFIDEIDILLQNRNKKDINITYSSATNTFLVQMDGFDSNEDIIVMGSTNDKELIDPAGLSRLATQLYIPPLDANNAVSVFVGLIQTRAKKRLKASLNYDLQRNWYDDSVASKLINIDLDTIVNFFNQVKANSEPFSFNSGRAIVAFFNSLQTESLRKLKEKALVPIYIKDNKLQIVTDKSEIDSSQKIIYTAVQSRGNEYNTNFLEQTPIYEFMDSSNNKYSKIEFLYPFKENDSAISKIQEQIKKKESDIQDFKETYIEYKNILNEIGLFRQGTDLSKERNLQGQLETLESNLRETEEKQKKAIEKLRDQFFSKDADQNLNFDEFKSILEFEKGKGTATYYPISVYEGLFKTENIGDAVKSVYIQRIFDQQNQESKTYLNENLLHIEFQSYMYYILSVINGSYNIIYYNEQENQGEVNYNNAIKIAWSFKVNNKAASDKPVIIDFDKIVDYISYALNQKMGKKYENILSSNRQLKLYDTEVSEFINKIIDQEIFNFDQPSIVIRSQILSRLSSISETYGVLYKNMLEDARVKKIISEKVKPILTPNSLATAVLIYKKLGPYLFNYDIILDVSRKINFIFDESSNVFKSVSIDKIPWNSGEDVKLGSNEENLEAEAPLFLRYSLSLKDKTKDQIERLIGDLQTNTAASGYFKWFLGIEDLEYTVKNSVINKVLTTLDTILKTKRSLNRETLSQESTLLLKLGKDVYIQKDFYQKQTLKWLRSTEVINQLKPSDFLQKLNSDFGFVKLISMKETSFNFYPYKLNQNVNKNLINLNLFEDQFNQEKIKSFSNKEEEDREADSEKKNEGKEEEEEQ